MIARLLLRPRAACIVAGLAWPTEDSPSGLWRSPGTRVGLIALRGSNPLSSAVGPLSGHAESGLETSWPPLGWLDANQHEEAYGAQGRHPVARVLFDRCRRPLLLFRVAPLARAGGRHHAFVGDGAAHRDGCAGGAGCTAGGVHPVAHPQAGVG